ncbi:unnamed protein product [Taenia asiatica]|uniref:PH domain-containing protein n=1 Tax=Taenia asiatica TaxID=60517 RepID=A0A0R3WAX3_TAEAS|nr:unnamed protein product [Taenia asiatica]
MAKQSFQTDFQPAQKADEQLLHWQQEGIDDNLSKNIKEYLSSDAVPKINALNHLEVQDRDDFVNFTNCLIGGLRYTSLYTCGQNTSGSQAKSVSLPATSKEWLRPLNIMPRMGVRGTIPTSKLAPLPASLAEGLSLREIESQISDLAGALQLRLNMKLDGLRFVYRPTRYKVKISIAPYEADGVASIENLLNFSKFPLMKKMNRPVNSKVALSEWVLDFYSKSQPYSVDRLDDLIQDCSDSKTWCFSSTEYVFPVEPGAALVTDVVLSKKNQKVYKLSQFLTTEPQTITIELSNLPSPYIEIEVKWLPLTQMDLLTLEKYPVPRDLMKEWDYVSSMGKSSQNLGCASLARELRRQVSPNGGETEHELDGGFDSMRSEGSVPTQSASSRSSGIHPDCRKPLRAEHNISITQATYNISSDNSIFQLPTIKDEEKEGDFDRSRDKGDGSHCKDTMSLASLLDSVQNEVETINRQPNRYQVLLYELSRVLQVLQEQLSSSSSMTATKSLKCETLSASMEFEIEESIAILENAICDPSEESVPAIGTWTQPLTSGWDQLDSVIRWHLCHVSHLIQHLGSSSRLYNSSPGINNDNKSLLCINEDLLAMALDAQSEILSDITGLVLNFGEERDLRKIFTNSHCLAHCGTDSRAFLFSDTFWSRFFWHTPSSGLDGTRRPTLMIQRTDLSEYLLQEYGALDIDDENKQSLNSAIDNLIDKVMDLDLADDSGWNEVPLTQLCNRLKLSNFQSQSNFGRQNLKLGSPNDLGGNSLTQSASNVEPSISLALRYLIKQATVCICAGKLQHELRESDEGLLLCSLETLVDNLSVSSEKTDRRSELMALSVENFICLAYTLEREDDPVTACASRAICALEDLTRTARGVILQSNPLPFLRTAGPCCAFLNELDMFSRKVRSANLRSQEGNYRRGRITNMQSGYSLISPVGTAILWAMQCPDEEDYRMAALAAWDCLSAPTRISLSHSSGRPHSYLFKQQPRKSGVTGVNQSGGRDQGPIQAEVRRMNLADDSAKVRRMALRILVSRQISRSMACSLDMSC